MWGGELAASLLLLAELNRDLRLAGFLLVYASNGRVFGKLMLVSTVGLDSCPASCLSCPTGSVTTAVESRPVRQRARKLCAAGFARQGKSLPLDGFGANSPSPSLFAARTRSGGTCGKRLLTQREGLGSYSVRLSQARTTPGETQESRRLVFGSAFFVFYRPPGSCLASHPVASPSLAASK